MHSNTIDEYIKVIQDCKSVFEKKFHDYGTAWTILRTASLTDQILIKAQRIRSLQENKENKVDEGQGSEFIGIINYCIMALIQLESGDISGKSFEWKELSELYDKHASSTRELLAMKNHDYGEAWRDMRVSSITDIILMKLLRVKQIEDNEGNTLISEGVDANYQDMINYAVFAMIHMS